MACHKFGNWQLFLDEISGECYIGRFGEEFNEADLSEKVRMSDKLFNSRSAAWIEDYLKRQSARVSAKNEENAAEERLKGNKFFQKKQFEKAKACYDQECVMDIENAMRHEYPSELQAKLFVRQAQAYVRLSQPQKAKKCINRCLLLMIFCFDFLLLLNTEKYKKHLQKCQTELEKCVQGTSVTSCASEPVYGFSKTIEQASSSVKLRYTKEKGRYLQVGVAHLALRVILMTSVSELQRFGAHEHFVSEELAGLSDTGVYSRNYTAVYHLLPHNESMLREDLIQYALTAALLLKCLDHTEYFKNHSPDFRFSIGGLLLRHICQLVCNAHAITRLEQGLCSQAVVECQQVRIATAIYPTTSLLNHSCDPSIIARKNELFVRLVKDVKAGEEIFNCYGPHYARMPKKERQEVLQSQYFFKCDCSECTAEEPLENLLKAYRCQKCSHAIISTGTQEVLKCSKCVTMVDMNQLSAAEKQSSDDFMSSLKCLQVEDIDGAIKKLKNSLDIRKMIYHRNHKLLTEAKDALARCYCIKGQFTRAVPLLKDCLLCVETAFGSRSIELANELHKYAEVLVNARKLDEALETVNQSIDILRLNYGPEYSTAKEMEELRSNILKYK
ncbi:hypothetical protein CAPTEDRAFT_197951 [Capitella teleta]|uniref:SET domain-containing protein n=1 Tax=Capitella teleta TaxID=283909 RepID=R7U589_CAPTE|nr:hypothetical protein CAPTEDRAFT_197951 [Capitella teleta]|eukprot:ELU01530.1 hypothetical protein CAPTEDRAFT_197951 [Capitella teleta]